MDGSTELVDAFAELSLDVHRLTEASDRGRGVVLSSHGMSMNIQVTRRALVDEHVAEVLTAQAPPSAEVMVVVADRVTRGARRILTGRGVGYLDLRGHLALRANGVVIDSDVAPSPARASKSNPLAGRVGLEVAVALLMAPARPTAVRELARDLNRSPSMVSGVLSALRRDGTTDKSNRVVGTSLFWMVADRWPTSSTPLARGPSAGDDSLTQVLRLGLNDVDHVPGWALTGSAAAVAYGAPLAIRADPTLDFFVPTDLIVRRAMNLLGAATSPATAVATVRNAPVPAVVGRRVEVKTNPTRWPLAHPVVVALDLAQDEGRGRETLDHWTPPEPWARVW